MRIRSLQLLKYGHFADHLVEFGPGLTVVYGRNEAGKSTLLDALSDFLWGIGTGSHRRAYEVQPKAMALVGEVDIDGTSVTLRRRLNDLVDTTGTTVPAPWGEPAEKYAWLHGFGLDNARLLAGGQTIVAGGNDPAGVEFLAETGIDIDAVRKRIQTRMDKLFKDRKVDSVEVRQIITGIRALDEQIRRGQSSARDVAELRRRLDTLKETISDARTAQAGLRRQHTRTAELLKCWDNAGRLRQGQALVAQTRDAGRCLPVGETQTLDEALTATKTSAKDLRKADRKLATLRAREQELTPDAALLVHGELIDSLIPQVESRSADHLLITGDRVAIAESAVRNCLEHLGMIGQDIRADYERVLLPADRINQLNDLAATLDTVQKDCMEQQRRVEKAAGTVAESQTDDASTTDDGLMQARTLRNKAWAGVRGPWLTGDLPDTAERTTRAADVDRHIDAVDVLAESAGAALAAAAEARGRRRAREAALAGEKLTLAAVDAKAATVADHWAHLVADTRLPRGLDTAAWRSRANSLQALADAWTQWRDLARDAKTARTRFRQFAEEVASVATLLDSPAADTFVNLQRLRSDLEQARTDAGSLTEVTGQLSEWEGTRADAKTSQQQADALIADICGDEDAAELVARSRLLHSREQQVEDLLNALGGQIEPSSDLAEVLTELADSDKGELQAARTSLDTDLDAASATLSGLSEELGALKTQIAQVEGRDTVAQLKAERQERLTQLRDAVDEYRSLYLQREILNAYRDNVADSAGTTTLDVAGRFLARMTAGRYTGFAIITEDQSRVLRIVSGGDGDEVRTSELSTGTEYQVYFALRLAGIAARQQDRQRSRQPSLPVVLDDVLLAYDDYRAKATLELLGELGREFQIILLTHSAPVLTDARVLDGVNVVDLPQPG